MRFLAALQEVIALAHPRSRTMDVVNACKVQRLTLWSCHVDLSCERAKKVDAAIAFGCEAGVLELSKAALEK